MRLIEKDNYTKSLVNKLNENKDSNIDKLNNLDECINESYSYEDLENAISRASELASNGMSEDEVWQEIYNETKDEDLANDALSAVDGSIFNENQNIQNNKNNLKESDSNDYAFVGTIGEFLEEIDDAKLMSGEDAVSKNVLDFLHLLISLDYHSNYSKIKVNNLNAAANWQPGDLLEITLDDNIKLTIK